MHVPVLTKEVLQYIDPKPNENFIDGTVGQARHTLLILEKTGPAGRVLGIDLDAGQIENSRLQTEKFQGRVALARGSYGNMREIAKNNNFTPVHGVLLDLGYSSWQIEDSRRGFSFMKDEPLDMRYDAQGSLTAEKIINEYPQDQIKKILEEYGEEKFAKRIAQKIIEQRSIKKIQTTFQLKEVVERAIPAKFRHGKIHCATKSFQAIRIATNKELDSLEEALSAAISVLAPGGRLVVISFHSLEDRIVKRFFKEKEQEGAAIIATKKPVMASGHELMLNPRSRSAKLRAIVKV